MAFDTSKQRKYCDLQVLDDGQIVEFDTPYILMQKTEGLLHQLVEQTGKSETANLLGIAKNAQERSDNSGKRRSMLLGSQHFLAEAIEEDVEADSSIDNSSAVDDNNEVETKVEVLTPNSGNKDNGADESNELEHEVEGPVNVDDTVVDNENLTKTIEDTEIDTEKDNTEPDNVTETTEDADNVEKEADIDPTNDNNEEDNVDEETELLGKSDKPMEKDGSSKK